MKVTNINKMSKRKSHLFQLYSRPLPIRLNALSLKNILFGFHIPQDEIVVKFRDGVFQALDLKSIDTLWFDGFFGKGSLSRSEPTFAQRTRRRLKMDGSGDNFSAEEVTKLRRLERLEFKAKRSELEKLENAYKLASDLENLSRVETLKAELTAESRFKRPVKELAIKYGARSSIEEADSKRAEDEFMLQDPSIIDSLEYLQLMPCEVLFLSLINRIVVIDDSTGFPMDFKQVVALTLKSVELEAGKREFAEFLTYYHYRTLGWCVKSGTKFSADFVLYEKGPVFQHAPFAVLLMDREIDWIQVNSINRVVSGVKKQLVLNYTSFDTSADAKISSFNECDDDDELESRIAFSNVLKCCGVREIGLNRWSSSRNRE